MEIACNPATPAPTTKTFAGVSVPAAVIIIGNIRGAALAASRTALYPTIVAIDDRTSIDWARVIRGINSSENEVTRRSASTAIGLGSHSGSHSAIRIWFACNCWGTVSGWVGSAAHARTWTMTFAESRSARSAAILAPC